ncbi:MAG: hypothetical protein HY907_22980 [Deltaproteobacteria bacterium]|nr:hypothetical protein [Deltaproteobacteria bacterium]
MRFRLARLPLFPLLLPLVLWGCGDGATDVDDADVDAVEADVAPDAPDAAEADAPDAPAETTDAPDGDGDAGGPPAIRGHVTYDRRPIDAVGLGSAVPAPAAGVIVRFDDGTVEFARTTTADDGSFYFEISGALPPPWMGIRILVVADGGAGRPLQVADFDDATYAVRTDPFGAMGGIVVDVAIHEADNAGAFAIFDTMRDGLRTAETALELDAPLGAARARWERGRTTPGGTSYLDGDQLWLLGGPDDTDEYDTSVVLHELGHFIQTRYAMASGGSGYPHAGADTDPRLAWAEGWATFFSCLALDAPLYLDSVSGSIGLDIDLERLPTDGEYVANPARGMSQTLSEWIVAGTTWALLRSSPDTAFQRRRSLAVIRDWFSRVPTPDRGVSGYDLVDFLDGYLCLGGGADEATIRDYTVAERRFPYDLAPPCVKDAALLPPGEPPLPPRPWPPYDKPGRPRLAVPIVPPVDDVDRGAVEILPSGERLRVVRVPIVVRPARVP